MPAACASIMPWGCIAFGSFPKVPGRKTDVRDSEWLLELMQHEEGWVHDRLGHRHLGFDPEELESTLRAAGFGSLTREVHPRQATSPFRVFLLTGEKR